MVQVYRAWLLVAALLQSATAQIPGDGNSFTVLASVVLNRIGERTPKILNDRTPVLTTTGAQQMFAAGSYFRDRYFNKESNAKLYGISSTTLIDSAQVYTLAYDDQPDVASAQAFIQGLYPAANPSSNSTDLLDPTSIYNGAYVAAPLGGYQYPQVHAADIYDPEHIYINGGADCPAFDLAARDSGVNTDYKVIQNATRVLYQRLQPLLKDVIVAQALDFANAYALYDYVSYHTLHDTQFASALSQYTGGMNTTAFLSEMRYLADQEQSYELANMTAQNPLQGNTALPFNTTGSISTIGGNFLAAKILANLQVSIQTAGQYYKLSTLFTDFEPMLSLFSLMALPHTSSNFTGLPAYGSSAVFELCTWENVTNSTSLSSENLYVSFYFRNGSDTGSTFQRYSAFERGPSNAFMSWRDFNELMYAIMLDDPGTWCTQCAATNLFCAPWNNTLSSEILNGSGQSASSGGSSSSTSGSSSLSPAAAGAIGAIVALIVAALIFALIMLLGGVRFHRRANRKTSELGGFKGSAKMASDRDLVLPPQSAVVAGDDPRPGAHERSGSWEMKGQEKTVLPVHQERQRVRVQEEEDLSVNPFGNPVQARESF